MDLLLFVKRMERKIEAEPNQRKREEMRNELKQAIKHLEGCRS